MMHLTAWFLGKHLWVGYVHHERREGRTPMNVQEEVELLSRVDIFEGFSKEEIREILDGLLRRNVESNLEAGEVFYTPREPDGKLFILLKGRVRIFKMEEEATHEFTLEMVGAGSVFGEVSFTAHRLWES